MTEHVMCKKKIFCFLCACLFLFLLFPPAHASYKDIKKGNSGKHVLELKNRMRVLGYYTGNAKFNDTYASSMVDRVHNMQMQNGFAPQDTVTDEMLQVIYSDSAVKATDAPNITAQTAPLYQVGTLPQDYPTMIDAEGYLSDMSKGAYIYESRENGLWIYLTNTLQIRITQYTNPYCPLVWFESEIKMRGEEKLMNLMEENPRLSRMKDPRQITEDYNAVFGISDDFYGIRIARDYTNFGVIVREKEVRATKTCASGNLGLPNLELIALYEDGSMKTYESKEHTAQEYIDMGVTDTWAFGPILLRDGQINEKLYTAKLYQNLEPRNAMGMIDNGHYLFISVKGRLDESIGCTPLFIAQRMQSLSVKEALNLDGGNSVALVFMDDLINKPEAYKSKNYLTGVRQLSSLIGVGIKPEGYMAKEDE